ncbi:MAG: hypothetical protein QM680_11980 [Luteolibacter sp.]
MKKALIPALFAVMATCGVVYADSVSTTPVGYFTATIPGNGAQTALSVSLLNPTEYTGISTAVTSSTVTVSDAEWTENQWAGYLVALENSAGAEEYFLVTANTTDTLTISSTFDLTARYDAASNLTLSQPHTIGSLFGATSSDVALTQGSISTADWIYVWNGTSFSIYYFNKTSWQKVGSSGAANDDILYPDEGVFVMRRSSTELTLTFTGTVPSKPQVTTVPGNSTTIVATRFPVDMSLDGMGIQDLTNWKTGSYSNADRVYSWNGSKYVVYYHNGTNWLQLGSSGSADDATISANSFLFITRSSSADASAAGMTTVLPYTL